MSLIRQRSILPHTDSPTYKKSMEIAQMLTSALPPDDIFHLKTIMCECG